jgi:hypothetical protein
LHKSPRYDICINPYYEKPDSFERQKIEKRLRRFTKEELGAAKKRIHSVPDRGTDEEYYANEIVEYEFWKTKRR